jgi:cytochrome c biogenesis protein ResB
MIVREDVMMFEILKTAVTTGFAMAIWGMIFYGHYLNKQDKKAEEEYKKFWEDYYAKKQNY